MTIFIVGLACSLSAGSLLQYFGWAHLNEILLPWIGLTAVALIWLSLHQGKPASPKP
ncbi:hypothetical protein [Rouxiella sp. Mn2063]|uniref:hypothetical protein n=1 Tax=Rouxiella sp. Mn2063 TaxID=3395262 RepID=UPI003BDB8214